MGNHHDSIALDWVRGEIQETLIQGQQALEGFVENRDDTARLRFCLNYLHQVHGTLQMVELYGAALLTEEMEKLTQAILNETVASVDEAVEVLMEAILQLPQYLEHLASSKDDFPLVLLPLLNDLRAARGESLLSDTSLFKPDLSPAQKRAPANASQRLQDPKVLGHIRKLRQMYQFALAGIVREEDLHAHLDYLQKVIQRLIKLCLNSPREQLWIAAGAFIESIQSGDNPVNTAVKSILRTLDSELKRLIDEHIDILQQPVPQALFKHLLYYVARARDLNTPYASRLRADYKLDEALPSDDDVSAARSRVAGPGREAIHSVVSALNEELAKLKDQLDLFVRAEYRSNQELEDLQPGLRQVANTLAVLGLGIPRQVVSEQIDTIAQLVNQTEAVDDGTLMDIAGALLYIEASLAGLDSDHPVEPEEPQEDGKPRLGIQELSDASNALLRESRNTLEQVKTAVVNFLASQWDQREIEHVPGLLHSICGGLRLIPLNRVADILDAAERYISQVLLSAEHAPEWNQMEPLADTITSIEYYLEQVADGVTSDSILDVAERSLEVLGFPAGAEPTWQHPQTAAEAPTAPLESPEPVADTEKASDDELLDDEILEIFVEEASEVLETIHEYFPRLYQDHDDREALTEVRRAFHTLKGSGRMVNAKSLGELAWAVENLLNRVIEQTVKPNDDLFSLVSNVNDRIPQLIEEFRHGKADGDVSDLIARAEALATTSKVSTFNEPEPEPEPAPEITDSADALSQPDTEELPVLEVTGEEANLEPEPLPTVTTREEPEADDDLIDDEILEIFVEEAGEVLDTIRQYLPMLVRQFDDRSALAEVRRAFHTLKGSGRMVGALVVGELSWSIENMLNRVIDGSILMNETIGTLLQDVTAVLPDLVRDFEQRQPASLDPAPLEARANAIASGDIPDTRAMPEQEEPEYIIDIDVGSDLDIDDSDDNVDSVLLDIFESETETHLQTLRAFLDNAGDKASAAYTDDVSRALHTLKGSAHTASIAPIANVITPLERYVKDARAAGLKADRDVLALMADACRFLNQGLAQLREDPQATLAGTEEYLQRLNDVAARSLGRRDDAETKTSEALPNPHLVQLFLSEGLDTLLDADRILDQWIETPTENQPLDMLGHELQQLASGGDQAGLNDVSDLARLLAELYAAMKDVAVAGDLQLIDTLRAGHEQLINMMDQIAAGLAAKPDNALNEALQALLEAPLAPEATAAEDAFGETFGGELEAIDRGFELELDEMEAEPAEPPQRMEVDEEDDQELAEIFLEEARELVDNTAETLHQWSENPDTPALLQSLQRDLHTLKGGARLSDIPAIGDLAHELETLFEGLTDERLAVNDRLSDLLFRSHDRLTSMVDALEQKQPPRPAPDLIAEIHAYIEGDQEAVTAAEVPEEDIELPTITEAFVDEAAEIAEPDLGVEPDESEADSGAGEIAEDSVAQAPDFGEESSMADLDPELAEIFLEEAGEIIDTTSEQLHQWQNNPEQPELVKELQRELHTLKGGARMADINAIADIAHEMETLFERIADGRIAATDARTELALRAHDQLAALVEAIADSGHCPSVPGLVQELHAACSDGQAETTETEPQMAVTEPDVDETVVPEPEATIEEAAIPEPEADSLDLSELEQGISEMLTPGQDDILTESEENADTPANLLAEQDPELVGIFLEEAYDLINSTGSALHAWSEDPASRDIAAELQRDVHTLKGGARMAGVAAIGDLTHVLEDLFEKIAEGQIAATPQMVELLFACHDRLAQMVEQVATQKPCPPAHELEAEVKAILSGTPAGPQASAVAIEDVDVPAMAAESTDSSDDLVGVFLDEGLEIHAAIDECLSQWKAAPDELTGITQLQQELHTLKGGARLADADVFAELAEHWESLLDSLVRGSGNQTTVLALSERANDALQKMLNGVEEGEKPVVDPTLLADIKAAEASAERAASEADTSASAEPVDQEVIEIFLEEAAELVDQLEHLLADWQKDPGSHHFNQEAQRVLHTLKGGARLAQLKSLGDRSHGLETRLIDLGGNLPNADAWQAITADYDGIVAQLAEVKGQFETGLTPAQPAEPAKPENTLETPRPSAPITPAPAPEQAAPLPAAAEPAEAPVQQPKPARQPVKKAAASTRTGTQESIRVSAPLLDELVNLAGETSITRGRLEQQTSDFSYTLDEMAATIERLREQLRRMDIETEAQILFRTEREHGPDYGEDFDPLEMDRYSSIQQLSRALSESSSDLADLRETLSDRIRDTETLLVQQSRINTELQEGLMKTRMIPFASMVPRLRRIVRQISGELGKKVEFDVRNPEGEMDRNILERMIAPLEHMLRNALDHGIEMPDERKAAGKPEAGEITLSLTREGGDVVLRMIDDGKGIPIPVIRDKAIRQGMLREDEDLTDREVLQFILQPGFSTAQKVTQISGRGVGMDVVASEIKQLGGALDIDSALGQGTTFTVRLPFTVSVNRALMVTTGEDFYAIPLNTIEGIVRVSTYELEEYYKPDAPLYEYAGQQYRLQYLGSLLHSEHQPKLQGQALPLPVILVRGAEQPMALQVDSLLGSREIVVKSLGPQFSSVRGVSGATILGDGNVVVILDLPAMIRSDILSERQRQARLQGAQDSVRREERATIVMVVDDSVTVRKVTSRLLERNGMEVVTAKDGLDAVAQLQDHRPDIILLDIEMPRMDGFEVASFVRHDETLRDTPICMITSRTGQKHRDRALSIGVNEYLGKPFQEAELLATIERLTGDN
ncbi:Hpt domain-containing protein [Marinobacter mobilis]|uniref:Chemotaxis protein CheA n=1 Tax=Marinobacter mobilis TaxID=488533 RepID=A0A1H2WYG1_9GAMM|nr:Hpt domain-containing protein [Marinobacter mobilis]SDW85611.1 chemosensory pili system protein ChpA (sensor histidine kinase/response regulator) [Marinobacter mobilis]SDX67336.1 chemosensory pili system protein ChpA (sensor histidine kinase/response regulator) [Marinobacter mobilis]